jgi:hypothetical protein
MKKFKAIVPFAAVGDIFSPGDEGKADAHLVEAWAEVEYCEDLGFIVVEDDLKEPEDLEPQNEPVEPPEEEDDQTPDEDETEPENVENEAELTEYDTMKYHHLKKAAKEAGIKGYNTMKQADLIAALKGE